MRRGNTAGFSFLRGNSCLLSYYDVGLSLSLPGRLLIPRLSPLPRIANLYWDRFSRNDKT
ncbi:hypothetical protein EYF80_028474 [Liparis tanakae]|uniref:Uncharacterized protein n=1 Tax=Liparis tanakae TaxID=230148 RepID=A0A4Z2H6M8_9TELE|nr:hypothetical protein EYF80_028474 [Liparis tanakae]